MIKTKYMYIETLICHGLTKLSFSLFSDDTTEEGGEGETEEVVSYTITGEVNFTSSKMNRCATRSLGMS